MIGPGSGSARSSRGPRSRCYAWSASAQDDCSRVEPHTWRDQQPQDEDGDEGDDRAAAVVVEVDRSARAPATPRLGSRAARIDRLFRQRHRRRQRQNRRAEPGRLASQTVSQTPSHASHPRSGYALACSRRAVARRRRPMRAARPSPARDGSDRADPTPASALPPTPGCHRRLVIALGGRDANRKLATLCRIKPRPQLRDRHFVIDATALSTPCAGSSHATARRSPSLATAPGNASASARNPARSADMTALARTDDLFFTRAGMDRARVERSGRRGARRHGRRRAVPRIQPVRERSPSTTAG